MKNMTEEKHQCVYDMAMGLEGQMNSIKQPDSPTPQFFPGSESIGLVNYQSPATVMVSTIPDPESPPNMTQQEKEPSLEQTFPRMVKRLISAIQRGTLTHLEEPIYNKYTVDGHRVGSLAYKAFYESITERNIGRYDCWRKYILPPVRLTRRYIRPSLPAFENIIKTIKFSG